MPAGLQVINSLGTVQIDENWKNYGFRQHIDFGISISLPTLDPFIEYVLTVPGQMAMIAIKCSVFCPIILSSYFDGANYIFKILFMPPNAAGTHSETVRVYAFDVPPGGGFSNVGLEVFDAAGQRVYHSDVEVMKIAGVQSCDTPFYGVSGRSYAPIIAIPPFFKEPGSGFVYSWGIQTFGSNLIPLQTLAARYVAPFSGSGGPGLYAAVDVTDYP